MIDIQRAVFICSACWGSCGGGIALLPDGQHDVDDRQQVDAAEPARGERQERDQVATEVHEAVRARQVADPREGLVADLVLRAERREQREEDRNLQQHHQAAERQLHAVLAHQLLLLLAVLLEVRAVARLQRLELGLQRHLATVGAHAELVADRQRHEPAADRERHEDDGEARAARQGLPQVEDEQQEAGEEVGGRGVDDEAAERGVPVLREDAARQRAGIDAERRGRRLAGGADGAVNSTHARWKTEAVSSRRERSSDSSAGTRPRAFM
jgi:hypothetical protein